MNVAQFALRGAACLAAIVSLAAPLSATPLVQTDPNGLAFHSRAYTTAVGIYELDNDGTEVNGVVYTPPNPGYAGSLMWIAGPNVGEGTPADIDTDLSDGLQTYAEYTVRFTQEGVYRVHWAGQRTGTPQSVAEGGTTGSNDSLWLGPVDQDHTGTENWVQLALGAGGISYRSSNALWTIDNTNVNTDLTFTVGLREDGPIYDRVAFVLEGSGIAPTDLTVVPEPSSMVLAIGAVGVGALGWRRRRTG